MTAAFRIGIDLGGTKIEGAAIDRSGTVQARRRIATPAGDYAGTVAAVVGLVRGIEAELGVGFTVGVGIPGTLTAAARASSLSVSHFPAGVCGRINPRHLPSP